MANVLDILFPGSFSRQVAYVLLLISLAHTQNIVGKTMTHVYEQFIRFCIKIASLSNVKDLAKC